MEQCYSWENNILNFTDVNDNKYCLKFKGNKTIVCGNSATGKTLICNMLRNYIDDNNVGIKPYNVDNIFLLSRDNKDKVYEQKDKLIIIDRAEIFIDSELVNFINADRGTNRYLIFLRKPIGIELSPNYFATLIRVDNRLELAYQFDVKGWT